jgi:hypothetical protein
MNKCIFEEYQNNFIKDVQKNDYKLLLKSNNLVISLLRHLIKKNQVASAESIIIKNLRVEIILDLSGFDNILISESLKEISYLGNYAIAPFEYHIGLLSIILYDKEELTLKLHILKEVFLPLRKELLGLRETIKESVDRPSNQISLF